MRKTALHQEHLSLGAKMIQFHGWEMPLSYTGIREEHRAVREHAGLFDLGHMGRLRLEGPDRTSLLERVSSNRIDDMVPGEARYSILTDEDGNAIDDVIVYRFADHDVVVVNASNREADLAWLLAHRDEEGFTVEVQDRSEALSMVALQGPSAEGLLSPHLGAGFELSALGNYHAAYTTVLGTDALIARTGYTGEDGFELYFDRTEAPRIWRALLKDAPGLVPVGLGARDSLRLEAAMPLYGHELTREINPFEAGLSFAVKLEGRSFVGSEALRRVKAEGPRRRLCCVMADGKRLPRDGYSIRRGGEEIGVVTSGTYSPILDRPICMALLDPAHRKPGTELVIDVRGKSVPGWVTKRPFYKRARS